MIYHLGRNHKLNKTWVRNISRRNGCTNANLTNVYFGFFISTNQLFKTETTYILTFCLIPSFKYEEPRIPLHLTISVQPAIFGLFNVNIVRSVEQFIAKIVDKYVTLEDQEQWIDHLLKRANKEMLFNTILHIYCRTILFIVSLSNQLTVNKNRNKCQMCFRLENSPSPPPQWLRRGRISAWW